MGNGMTKSRLAVAVGVVGMMGLGASQAIAADFDVTAEVQNALEVTQVQPMNLGTIFATESAEFERSTLVLSPDGTIAAGEDSGANAPTLLSLGGQQAARGSVAADNAFVVTLPNAEVDTVDLGDGGTTAHVTETAGAVEVRINGAGGDPNVARLYLVNFRLGDAADATLDQDHDGNADDFTYEVNPDFGITEVEFGIGATISTDDSTDRNEAAYEEGIYEGTFEVTAEF